MDYEQIIIGRLEEGTLIRNAWTGEKDGKEMACLLAAIVPKCGRFRDAKYCPAETMPQWLAYLTPWIDDAGSVERWESFVRRFAATSLRWGKLTQRHEYAVRALIVREAVKHTVDPEAIAVCNRVVELCDGVAAGGEIDGKSFFAAMKAADLIAARECAADVAEYAAGPAEYAVSARAAAANAAADSEDSAATADSIIDGILCVLESA